MVDWFGVRFGACLSSVEEEGQHTGKRGRRCHRFEDRREPVICWQWGWGRTDQGGGIKLPGVLKGLLDASGGVVQVSPGSVIRGLFRCPGASVEEEEEYNQAK